jgi:hypothetical protein
MKALFHQYYTYQDFIRGNVRTRELFAKRNKITAARLFAFRAIYPQQIKANCGPSR